jgi:hypothetical protein
MRTHEAPLIRAVTPRPIPDARGALAGLHEFAAEVHASRTRGARDEALVEDVEWMAGGGAHLEEVARRLGLSPVTLADKLQDLGRVDLLDRLR